MFLSPTDPKEIQSLIQNLDESKASDIYDTSIKLLKMSNNCLSNVISDIINHSFTTGVFPDKLKSGFPIWHVEVGGDFSRWWGGGGGLQK